MKKVTIEKAAMSLPVRPLAMLMSLALSACAVGPNFHRPATALPEHYARQATPDDTAAPDAANAAFWQSFNDPELNRLIEQALAANNDLRAAMAHVDSANALLRQDKLDLLPTVTASAQGGRNRLSDDQSFGFIPRTYDTYSGGINASWELDLFGRVRRGIEAQRAETASSADDLAALQVSVVGQLASTYVDLRGQQERLRVARENSANQRETLRLVEARLVAGYNTDLDTARARAQLETTSSHVPALEALVAVDEHRLAVLTGKAPESLIAQLDTPAPLPALPSSIDPGTPANLLRRRPDVAAAEERLHAASARVGVATADLFPRVSFSGLLGTYAFSHDALFQNRSENDFALLGIDWSFLDIGRVRARLAASRADAAGLLASYQQTVLLALEDTENALVRYQRGRYENDRLQHAAQDATHAAELAKMQYEAGTIGLYELLDAQRQMLMAQDACADSHTRSGTAAVALYQALAGGWPVVGSNAGTQRSAPSMNRIVTPRIGAK
jgi:NodT family efflux transporter outer membrane factor (OMF) lipoprotein